MPLIKNVAILIVLSQLMGCTSLLFQPQRPHLYTPDVLGVSYDDLNIKTPDSISLHGWILHAEGEPKGSVLFFHGNAENISTHFANVHWLTNEGFNVYLFDYRGYGKSEGVAQLDGVVSDVKTMIDYTIKQIPENEKLAIMGHSIGGGLAIYGVAKSNHKDRIKVLVTVETLSDYHHAAQDILSLHWLTWLFQWPLSFAIDNSYRPLDVVAEIAPIPLVLVHSTQDKVLPYYHSEALLAAADEPKKLELVLGSHTNVFDLPENRKIILDYLIGRRLSLVPGRLSK